MRIPSRTSRASRTSRSSRSGRSGRTSRAVRTVPVLLAAVLALASCGDAGQDRPTGPEAGRTLTEGTWSVESLSVGGRTLEAPPQAEIKIGPGAAEADVAYGCNGGVAELSAEDDGRAVTVKQGPRTMTACPDLAFENAFADLFKGRLAVARTGDALTLTAPSGDRISLGSAPRPPAPTLTGTRWSVDSLITGETVSSVPAGAEGRAELTIAADGAVTGSLGCNRFSSKAVVDGREITFGPVAATRMACTGPAGEVERAFSALLRRGPLRYAVQDDALTLTAADGTGLRAKARTGR
ncbi:META domain-containing protein [Streptomyces sp. NPDC089799]|uniref:META domain-containing protein n=1 Tax=Streptomyces sp. NPDC089799 TaxID=3155066 RepID=UPI003423BF34